jgi:hypothetical protein
MPDFSEINPFETLGFAVLTRFAIEDCKAQGIYGLILSGAITPI